ncbi:MAG: DNA primase [Holosporaceae bacterium]|jgi:DNA primase|nr:DNA primase [Holosporaceae bacterium]
MNKEFIELLKSQIPIVDVVSSRIRIRRSGHDWFGLCPFHQEKTGSFKVDPTRGFYHCFGCGAHGDVISFVQDFDKVSFSEAIECLAHQYGISLPSKEKTFIDTHKPIYEAIAEIKNWFMKQLNEPAGKMALKYLESRKISHASMEKFQLGFAPDNQELFQHLHRRGFSDDILLKTGAFNRSKYHNDMVNRYRGRLIFPILDGSGKCIGFGGRIFQEENTAKYINSPETEIFTKSDHLYGYFWARRGKTREIILAEGYLDVISMHQAGFDGTVAPLGTSISEHQINLCWKVCDNPIISLDGDSAGVKASYRWIDRILPSITAGRSFKFAKLPEGLDPDQLIANGQTDVLKNAIANAVSLSDWMWEGAFLLYPSETPEQKAAIMKMLADKIETIRDVSVRKLYAQAFREKGQNLYRKKFSTPIKQKSVSSVIPIREKLEKIFIVTIINHPYILERIMENLVKLEFDNFHMQKLKKRILDCYSHHSEDMEKCAAAVALLKNEITADIKELELHARFSGENATDEEAVEGWFELMDRYCSEPVINADLQAATSNLKSTFSKDDWQRLKALKQEVISNRTNKRRV